MSPRQARRRVASVVLTVLAALLGASLVGGAAAAKDAGSTYVVQGVPGTDVDVLVDGKSVEAGVAAKKVVGPLALSPGSHTVTFRSPGWKVSKSVSVTGSQDVVLHWPADAANKPVVTVFTNDLAPVAPGKGRLSVAHTAVVPPADITAGGKTLFTNIANGEFVTAVVPATTYNVAVVPTGGGKPLLGPVDLPVAAGDLTRVFAIGAPRNGSMDAVVQVLPVPTAAGGGAPATVDTGSAGLVNANGSLNSARLSAWAAVRALPGWLLDWWLV